MTEPRFTPGPWRLRTAGNIGNAIEAFCGRKSHEEDDGYRILASYNDATASNLYKDEEANRLANGHLIAAAPTMYEALDHVEAVLSIVAPRNSTREYLETLRQVRAALAKARGESV